MDAKNLGVCFAPTLIEMPPSGSSNAAADMAALRGGIDLVAKLVTYTASIYDADVLYDGYPFSQSAAS
jgi:hypothetical protein